MANKTARDILIWYASHVGIIDPEHTDEALRQLFEAVEQIIGEDTPLKPGSYHGKTDAIKYNWLKAEQRARARTFFNIPETEQEGSADNE